MTPGQLLYHVRTGTVVLSSKHLQYAVIGAIATMLKQSFAADYSNPSIYSSDRNWHDKNLSIGVSG
jgi:hypothetical protein